MVSFVIDIELSLTETEFSHLKELSDKTNTHIEETVRQCMMESCLSKLEELKDQSGGTTITKFPTE